MALYEGFVELVPKPSSPLGFVIAILVALWIVPVLLMTVLLVLSASNLAPFIILSRAFGVSWSTVRSGPSNRNTNNANSVKPNRSENPIPSSNNPKPGKALFESQGTWRAIDMTNGLKGNQAAGGGFYYGYIEHVTFIDSFRGRTFNVEVKSQHIRTRIELWRGTISGDDRAWWTHYQQAASSSEGTVFEQRPNLQWVIVPGNYTLFFAAFSQSGNVSNVPLFARLNIDPPTADSATIEGDDERKRQEEGRIESQESELPSTSTPPFRTPVSGGVLNGKAIRLPQPSYPPLARQQHVSGQVTVRVLIDENGNVVSARAISGPLLLQSAAVSAAKQAKFTPTTLSGQQVTVDGVIHYKFIIE